LGGDTKSGLTVILQGDRYRHIITYAGTIFDLTFEDLDLGYLADSRHFHFSSFYLQRGLRSRVVELFQRIKAAGLTISLDPNDDPDDLWQGELMKVFPYVDVFLPNAREARKITGTENLETAMAHLAKLVPLVVVKVGAEGAIAQRGLECFASPALKVNAVDAVGAGDSFDAGLLSQYLRGSDLPTCLAVGNVAGALSTTRAGGTEAFRDAGYRQQFFRANGVEV